MSITIAVDIGVPVWRVLQIEEYWLIIAYASKWTMEFY